MSTLQTLKLRRQQRNKRKQIANAAIGRHLEDRRFLFRVDRDDHLAAAHPSQVLDSSINAARDVEPRRRVNRQRSSSPAKVAEIMAERIATVPLFISYLT